MTIYCSVVQRRLRSVLCMFLAGAEVVWFEEHKQRSAICVLHIRNLYTCVSLVFVLILLRCYQYNLYGDSVWRVDDMFALVFLCSTFSLLFATKISDLRAVCCILELKSSCCMLFTQCLSSNRKFGDLTIAKLHGICNNLVFTYFPMIITLIYI